MCSLRKVEHILFLFLHVGSKDKSYRPFLERACYLFVIACPCNCVLSSNHALLTERKDSVNGTGRGFMVWDEALSILNDSHKA